MELNVIMSQFKGGRETRFETNIRLKPRVRKRLLGCRDTTCWSIESMTQRTQNIIHTITVVQQKVSCYAIVYYVTEYNLFPLILFLYHI